MDKYYTPIHKGFELLWILVTTAAEEGPGINPPGISGDYWAALCLNSLWLGRCLPWTGNLANLTLSFP